MRFFSFSKLFGSDWRGRTKSKRAAKPARSNQVRLQLEELEDRVVPSVTPILPAALVSNPTDIGGGVSPQIAINPVNPLKLVEVHTTASGSLDGNYSTDGGQTWQILSIPGNIADPNLTTGSFTVAQSPSISFDRDQNVYIVSAQRNAANTSGAIVVYKLDFSGGLPTQEVLTPPPAPTGMVGNVLQSDLGIGVLYRWFNQDAAFNPVVAVDNNLSSFTDPDTGATQTDSMAALVNHVDYGPVPKAVYVAWNTNFVQANGTPTSRITVAASADGGHSFTTVQRAGVGTAPQMLFTQSDTTPGDGGRLTFFWNSSASTTLNMANGLAASISAIQLTVTIPTPSGTFGSSNFVVQIDNEQMLVLSASGANWQVVRGFNGTLIAAHANGAAVVLVGVQRDQSQPDGGIAATAAAATQTFTFGGPAVGSMNDSVTDASTASSASTTLTAAIDASQTTITVASSASFPETTPYVIKIDTEELRVTARSGNTWTVVRPVNGTTAATHSNGASITLVGTDDIPRTTTFTGSVSITAPNLTSINDLDVTINLIHPNLDQIEVILEPPSGSGLTPINLVRNRTNSANGSTGNGLAAGANLGQLAGGSAGTVFNQSADRIITQGSAPYVGHFRPEQGSLDQVNGQSLANLNGTWTLKIRDHRNSSGPSQRLVNWSLHFTGRISTGGFGTDVTVFDDTVAPSTTNVYMTTNAAAGTPGIGPGVVVAQDKTLGSFSPYQGRIYVAYTRQPGTNTDVFLRYSDDNGAFWSNPLRVNDDSIADNFSEGNRPQFMPSLTVDPLTGTVVVSYYDGRNDAAGARVGNAVAMSVDGGDHFSPVSYLNEIKTAKDFLTGEVRNLGPIPGNQAQAGASGFGDRQGIVAYGGDIFPAFATNLNNINSRIYTAKVATAAGPRVIFGDMGPVVTDFDKVTNLGTGTFYYNNTFATDGTRHLEGFVVQFDRPINVSTFGAADITVKYQNPNTGVFSNVALHATTPVSPLDMPTSLANAFGPKKVGVGTLATTFFIKFQNPQTQVGTYSYAIGPNVFDKIRSAASGNAMDQNANSVTSEPVVFAAGATTTINMPGFFGGGIDADDKQMTVASAAGFPSATPFVVQIGDEQLQVTAVGGSGNTIWTIERGFNGTTAADHFHGTPVNSINVPDIFSIPRPLPLQGASPLTGVPFSAPYDTLTLPLIIPGPHVVSTSLPGVASQTTTIVGEIGAFATTITVATATGFPTTPFAARIGSEDVWVTKVTGTAWTVQRGFDKSVAVGHANGSAISVGDSSDNLMLNGTVSGLDVTFNRNIAASTFTVADILSIVGPGGPISIAGTTILQSGGISAAATTMTVTSSTGFPATPFVVTIDNEQILVTNVAGTTWTIQRGQNGTTAATHANGAAVRPVTITPINSRTFRVGFPTQTLSGSYSINIGPNITDAAGNQVDTNLNVGLDVLRGFADPTQAQLTIPVFASDPALAIPANGSVSATISVADAFQIAQSTAQTQFIGQTTTINQAGGITVSATTMNVVSSVGFPSTPFTVLVDSEQIRVTNVSGTNWTIQRGFNGTTATAHSNGSTITLGRPATIELMLNIQHQNIPDLQAFLTAPNGTVVTLFTKTGTLGSTPHANMQNTIFDDLATSNIQNAGTPIPAGPFTPQTPLSDLNGLQAQGNWTLTIANSGSTAGTLTHWELRLPRTVPTSGLGEPNADRITGTFRIFTQATSNPQSSKQWTAVGPAGNTLNPDFNGDNAGSVTAVAADPADPSGNTVYIGAASGGIWKTTNFLTTDPNGPTWIPLTDLGPTAALNISSIAIVGRNNDPLQSVIVASTGNGPNSVTGGLDVGASGVGFLRSLDGGRTWQLLDSTVNVDGSGAILPISFSTRDHTFVGSSVYKVIADPTPQANGHVILYAAASGTNGGLWRSINSGNTWTRIQAGNATDVVLAAASLGTGGNLATLYVAFSGDGVYRSNGQAFTTSSLTKLVGGGLSTPRVDMDPPSNGNSQIPTTAPTDTPNGAKGRIVLAAPGFANSPLGDTFYQGWLYAAVSEANGTFNGLYLTKDAGLNWTKLNLPVVVRGSLTFPTNNETRANYDPVAGLQNMGNYALTLTVDPNNPNIVYLGGSSTSAPATMGTLFRIDATKLDDPYAMSAYANDRADGGLRQLASTGPTTVKVPGSDYGILNPFDPNYPFVDPQAAFFNLFREPSNPFVSPSSLQFTNVSRFNNSGQGVFWKPFNDALNGLTNMHQVFAVNDPITGGTRLMFADDQGVYTGVDDGAGTILDKLGSYSMISGSRNGNLQIAQFFYGAAQPSTLAADVAGALFYASGFNYDTPLTSGHPSAAKDILATGDIRWRGTVGDGTILGDTLTTGRITGGPGVGTDQTGSGQLYQYIFPYTIPSPFVPTDFFWVTKPNQLPLSRVSGLVQPGDFPGLNTGQWPRFLGSNFAVNPIDPTAIVISSQAGRIFLTAGEFTGGTGVTWNVIANPTQLDSTYGTALAFGSLNTSTGAKSDLIYVGTEGGKIFVTFTGGGFTDISSGLNGSPVMQIVTNPKPDSYEAYAVTTGGVFWMQDSRITGASWVRLSDAAGATTTIDQTGGISASATTMTVTSSTGFPISTPFAPFIAQIEVEQVLVTGAAGDTWTIQRGFNGTSAAIHANAATVTEVNPLFGLYRPAFNNAADPMQTVRFLTTIQADWRFAVPDAPGTGASTTINMAAGLGGSATNTTLTVASSAGFPTTPFDIQIDTEQLRVTNVSGTTWTVVRGINNTAIAAHANGAAVAQANLTHPVLYVGASGGVFRSQDKGQTWTYYPNVANDGATQEGGFLPNVTVADLELVLGNMNPTTGFRDASTGLNLLLATTYGRGDFTIRLDNSAVMQYLVSPNSGPKVTNLTRTVAANGAQFTGYIVTFSGAVDPDTFTTADVTVTGPNGAAVAVASVVDVSGTSDHNVYQITFATPQTTLGSYTLRVGPDIRDFSGNLMNQDGDNINGENPQDVFVNTSVFSANFPPTISDITNKMVEPGQSTPAIPFTVGDTETPAANLVVTAQVTNGGGFTGTLPTFTLGGSGANRTITLTAASGSHGPATVKVTVTDADGLTAQDTFTLNVNRPPTLPTITDPFVVNHGAPPSVINLNASDPDGDGVTFGVSLLDPLFNLKNTFGLTNAAYGFNTRFAGEWYFLSTNGSNAANGGYYLLFPDNKLYAWQGTLAATQASTPVATLTPTVYDNPALITSNTGVPIVTGTNPLFDLKVKLGLTTPAAGFNARAAGEWYLQSSNDSNSANGGYFMLLPNNTLVAWQGAIGNWALVADFNGAPYSTNVYGNPALLTAAVRPTTVGVTAAITNSTPPGELTVTPAPGFDRSVLVTVTVNDGVATSSDTFTYTVDDSPPTVPQPLGQTNTHNNATTTFNLGATDPGDGSTLVYSVDVSGYDALFDVKSQFGLTAPAYGFNAQGAGEWYFQSTNNSNAANGGYYLLFATNKLHAWQGNMVATQASAPVADFTTAAFGGANVYAAPGLVNGAVKPLTPAEFVNRGPLYDTKVKYGLTAPAYGLNSRGINEWYFQSTNNSNSANGGYYLLLPDNKLYAWQGSVAATTAQPPVADFSGIQVGNITVHNSPGLLTNALPSFVNDALYNLRSQLGLDMAAYGLNSRFAGEWYFQSTNNSNAANGGYYLLFPDNQLYAWQGTLAATQASTPVANFNVAPYSTNVYANPSLLPTSSGQAPAVVASVNSTGQVTLTRNLAFDGKVRVTATVSDGAQKTIRNFLFTVTNQVPTLAAIADVPTATSASGGTSVPLTTSDGDGDTLQFAAKISGYSALNDLKVQYGLDTAAAGFNARGFGEWYLHSSNGSNAAFDGYYLLFGDNKLYAWAGSIAATQASAPVADFNVAPYSTNVYANPALLTNAAEPPAPASVGFNFTGSTLNLTWPTSFAGKFRVTAYVGDGADEVQRSFLVTVSS